MTFSGRQHSEFTKELDILIGFYGLGLHAIRIHQKRIQLAIEGVRAGWVFNAHESVYILEWVGRANVLLQDYA